MVVWIAEGLFDGTNYSGRAGILAPSSWNNFFDVVEGAGSGWNFGDR
jgi:hypothetical protein